jgi:hypothetical protein
MRFVLIATALALLAGCHQKQEKTVNGAPTQAGLITDTKDSSNYTSIKWMEQSRDYGKINEGQKLEVSFRFKNTGDKPLVIESVRPSCGCTVADPPKEPIAPGATGEIKGAFDSNGKSGQQHKSIYVYANTKGQQSHELDFTVDVQKKQ